MLHPDSQDELLTPAGVAALLYVDPRTVTRWAAAGKLTAVRTPGGHRLYLRSEVLAIVSGLHPDHRDHYPDRDAGQDPSRASSQDSVMVPSCNGPTFGVAADVDSERQSAAAAVVAEAVALTLEAAAAEAAEAVLVTATAARVRELVAQRRFVKGEPGR